MSAQRSTSAQAFGRTRLPRTGKATVPPETVEEDDSARQEQDENEQGPAKNSAGEIANAGEDAEEQNDREGLDDQLDGTVEPEDGDQEQSLTERLFEELEFLKMKNQRLELEMNTMREKAAERPARKGTSGEESKGSERQSVRARVQAEKYGTALSDSKGDYMDPEDVWEGVDPYARLKEVSSVVRAAVMLSQDDRYRARRFPLFGRDHREGRQPLHTRRFGDRTLRYRNARIRTRSEGKDVEANEREERRRVERRTNRSAGREV
jgi:hypothetical protein